MPPCPKTSLCPKTMPPKSHMNRSQNLLRIFRGCMFSSCEGIIHKPRFNLLLGKFQPLLTCFHPHLPAQKTYSPPCPSSPHTSSTSLLVFHSRTTDACLVHLVRQRRKGVPPRVRGPGGVARLGVVREERRVLRRVLLGALVGPWRERRWGLLEPRS